MQNKVKINENNEMKKYNLTPKNTQKFSLKEPEKMLTVLSVLFQSNTKQVHDCILKLDSFA